MTFNNNYNAAGSLYETPAINTVIVSSEGMLCLSVEESNAYNEDFDTETNWTW